MTKLLTLVDLAAAEKLRKLIHGSATPVAVKLPKPTAAAAKKAKKPAQLVAAKCWNDGTAMVLQAPIVVKTENAGGAHWEKEARAKKQIDAVFMLLCSYLRGSSQGSSERDGICGLQMVRLSPRELDSHDNLHSCFKHVTDAVCAWIVEGDRVLAEDFDRYAIGKYDDKLLNKKTGRVQWHEPQQMRCPENPAAQGIQIRLHLRGSE